MPLQAPAGAVHGIRRHFAAGRGDRVRDGGRRPAGAHVSGL